MSNVLTRAQGRAYSELRPVQMERAVLKHADGSCLISMGDTKVLCAATIQEGVPLWRESKGLGWLTAEYAMLPTSTQQRIQREQRGRKGRSMEIERLIGRSLRACLNFKQMGARTITIDCDVLQADGGTRCASITGAWLALFDALENAAYAGRLQRIPITHPIAAVSCGFVDGQALLDLDYREDSRAEFDLNVVALSADKFIELQGTAEAGVLSRAQLNDLLDMGEQGIHELLQLQYELSGWYS